MTEPASSKPSPFSSAARIAFTTYLSDPVNRNRFQISDPDYALLCEFCLISDKQARSRKEDDLKNRAKKEFFLRDGKLYRRGIEASGSDARYVIRSNEVFDAIVAAHASNQHPGIDKTYKNLRDRYYGIVRAEVAWLLAHCSTCAAKTISKSQGPIQPLVVNHLFERVQIDLIDMRLDSDKGYKWICHMRDHFSKYSIAVPLLSKTSEEVKGVVLSWIMFFGPPHILQCDNGTEFKGVLLTLLHDHGIQIINGRPRHPQSQGLIEQANGIIKQKIGTWQIDNQCSSWVTALPEVILAMNTQYHTTTRKTPFEIVFKQRMATADRLLPQQRPIATIIDEENSDQHAVAIPTMESSIPIDPMLLQDPSQLLAEVRSNTEVARRRMVDKVSKHHVETVYSVGDHVSIKVPSKDRRPTHPRRLFGIIHHKPHPNRYHIKTKYGVLANTFVAKDIEPLPDTIEVSIPANTTNRWIGLGTAARLVARLNDNQIRCDCRGKCNTNRCICLRSSETCSDRCHFSKAGGKSTCSNRMPEFLEGLNESPSTPETADDSWAPGNQSMSLDDPERFLISYDTTDILDPEEGTKFLEQPALNTTSPLQSPSRSSTLFETITVATNPVDRTPNLADIGDRNELNDPDYQQRSSTKISGPSRTAKNHTDSERRLFRKKN